MKKITKAVLTLTITSLFLFTCGCGNSSSSAPSSSAASESESVTETTAETGTETGTEAGTDAVSGPDKIKIGVLKIADSFPLYVAENEGLFAEEGLDVEVVDFQSGSDQSVAYEAGELDGLMTDMIVQSLINKSAQGREMKAVAMALGGTKEEGRFLVISSPNGSIKEPKDLEGARIGIAENTMMEYLVVSYLKDLGVDIETVELINIPKLTLRLDSVIEGSELDAAILPDPLAIEAVNRGCNTVIDDTLLDKNYSQSVVTLSKEIIENYPEAAAAFVRAYDKAVEKINADPGSFEDLFFEKANVADVLRGKYTVPGYTPACLPTSDEVSSLQSWMVSKGLLNAEYSYEDICVDLH